MFTLKEPRRQLAIREQVVLGGRLLSITEKCTYAIQMADQIRSGPNEPRFAAQLPAKLFDYGVNSELLCRSFLHAKVMFRKEFQQIDIERAMHLSFDVLSELVAMDEAAEAFKAAEVPQSQRLRASVVPMGHSALPALGNVRAHCKTFAQKADHGAGALLEIVRCSMAK